MKVIGGIPNFSVTNRLNGARSPATMRFDGSTACTESATAFTMAR